MNTLKDEFARSKTAWSARERALNLELRKRDREIERLQDQLTLFMKDPVIAKYELKTVKIPESDTIKKTQEVTRTSLLESENGALRASLSRVYSYLTGTMSALGIVQEQNSLPPFESAPADWAASQWTQAIEATMSGLEEWVEEVRQTARQCRAIAPVLDSATEASTKTLTNSKLI